MREPCILPRGDFSTSSIEKWQAADFGGQQSRNLMLQRRTAVSLYEKALSESLRAPQHMETQCTKAAKVAPPGGQEIPPRARQRDPSGGETYVGFVDQIQRGSAKNSWGREGPPWRSTDRAIFGGFGSAGRSRNPTRINESRGIGALLACRPVQRASTPPPFTTSPHQKMPPRHEERSIAIHATRQSGSARLF
jgi:hypothetical protein